MIEDTVLETTNLTLRHWRESDAEKLYEMAKNPQIADNAGWIPHISPDYSLAVIRLVYATKPNRETFAIIDKRDSESPIGSISLSVKSIKGHEIENEAEIGYWIGSKYQGTGHATEALKKIICYAFVTKKLTKLWCSYFENNEASKHVMESCGFMYDHTENDFYVPMLREYRVMHICTLSNEK